MEKWVPGETPAAGEMENRSRSSVVATRTLTISSERGAAGSQGHVKVHWSRQLALQVWEATSSRPVPGLGNMTCTKMEALFRTEPDKATVSENGTLGN